MDEKTRNYIIHGVYATDKEMNYGLVLALVILVITAICAFIVRGCNTGENKTPEQKPPTESIFIWE